jgi:hypothetical protein
MRQEFLTALIDTTGLTEADIKHVHMDTLAETVTILAWNRCRYEVPFSRVSHAFPAFKQAV